MGSRFPDEYVDIGNPWGTPPGVHETEFKSLTTTGPKEAIYSNGVVHVTAISGAYNTVRISWPAVSGAVSYEVYSGFSLFFAHASLRVTITAPATTCTFKFYPSVPTDLQPQVWVKAILTSGSQYIQSYPASFDNTFAYTVRATNPLEYSFAGVIIDNDYMRFVFSEVRRRMIAMLQNDGEDFILYIRRPSGTVCPCRVRNTVTLGTDAIQLGVVDESKGIGEEPDLSSDPTYDQVSRCEQCFGTGILGGYFYGVPLSLRYSDLPPRDIILEKYALNLALNYNTRALWEPKLHDHDFVVRVKTGERFEITNSRRGEIRGIPMHQEAKLSLLPPGDIRYLITDELIQTVEQLPA